MRVEPWSAEYARWCEAARRAHPEEWQRADDATRDRWIEDAHREEFEDAKPRTSPAAAIAPGDGTALEPGRRDWPKIK